MDLKKTKQKKSNLGSGAIGMKVLDPLPYVIFVSCPKLEIIAFG